MSVNVSDASELKIILAQACPLCGEKALKYMGRVQQTNLVRTGVKAACDLRCTNAVGPKCDCMCSHLNHGTHRLVTFDKVVGRLEVVEKDLLNNNESYLARIKRMADAKNRIKVKVITFLTYRYRAAIDAKNNTNHGYIADNTLYYEYHDYRNFLQKIDKTEDLLSIQRKVTLFAKMIPQLGSTLDYLEALSAAKEAKEAVAA